MAENKKKYETSESVVEVPLTEIVNLDHNPNSMKDADFNDLVEKIRDKGFDQPIKVWWDDEKEKYVIVKGNHRFMAVEYLGYDTIPAVIAHYVAEDGMTEKDAMMADAMSDNVLRGDIDIDVFSSLYKQFKSKYGTDKTLEMLNLSTDDKIKKFIKDAREGLPDELKQKFDEVKDEIRTIDDLSRILNKIFNEHGDELDYGFMWFAYNGVDHFYVKMEKELLATLKRIEKDLKEQGININEVIGPAIIKGMAESDEKE